MNKIIKNCFISSYFYFIYNYLLVYKKSILLYKCISKNWIAEFAIKKYHLYYQISDLILQLVNI